MTSLLWNVSHSTQSYQRLSKQLWCAGALGKPRPAVYMAGIVVLLENHFLLSQHWEKLLQSLMNCVWRFACVLGGFQGMNDGETTVQSPRSFLTTAHLKRNLSDLCFISCTESFKTSKRNTVSLGTQSCWHRVKTNQTSSLPLSLFIGSREWALGCKRATRRNLLYLLPGSNSWTTEWMCFDWKQCCDLVPRCILEHISSLYQTKLVSGSQLQSQALRVNPALRAGKANKVTTASHCGGCTLAGFVEVF